MTKIKSTALDMELADAGADPTLIAASNRMVDAAEIECRALGQDPRDAFGLLFDAAISSAVKGGQKDELLKMISEVEHISNIHHNMLPLISTSLDSGFDDKNRIESYGMAKLFYATADHCASQHGDWCFVINGLLTAANKCVEEAEAYDSIIPTLESWLSHLRQRAMLHGDVAGRA